MSQSTTSIASTLLTNKSMTTQPITVATMSSTGIDAIRLVSSSLYDNDTFSSISPTVSLTTTPLPYNDSCGNSSRSDFIQNEAVQAIFCVLYGSIFILGIFGNALVCYVVFRNKAMQTVTNLFITNLALSDILLCVLAVPFTPLYTFLGRWIFGVPLCHIVPYAQGCSVYISTLTLTSIAIDRFFVIIYPFHPRMKLSTCIGIIIFIWVISLLVTFPYGLYVKVADYNGTKYCEEHWPSEEIRKVFSSTTSTLQFVLPFVIIAFCYICVSVRLNDRTRARPGNTNSRREEQDRDRKKRTNRMLIAMVAIFGISWLPLNVVNILNDFESYINCWRYYNVLFFISHLTAMASTSYNPFLYAWLNENFRKEFKQVLPCFDPSRGRTANGSGGKGAWRSERTCNGNNDTVQESLLPSSCLKGMEIKPRDPAKEAGMRASIRSSARTTDTILLSEVTPPPPPVQSQGTIMLPSGVLETPFESNTGTTTGRNGVGNGGLISPIEPTKLSSTDTSTSIILLDTQPPDEKSEKSSLDQIL
ncbi:neuropeptide Y receptor type 2-like [Culicoides brevitarsis]|uniref:neuropeptide Y receptor type 2-like n=1 Tax=Culicoides brevitarsis TaxID=469753 RepID=UPI00307C9099